MGKDKKSITLFILSIAGVLFSGYLSGKKFFTGTCAFNESCPYFLGYPACYFGFAMFLALAILGYLLVTGKMGRKNGLTGVIIVSLLGVLFAGYFTLKEIPILFMAGFKAYVLGLPTCALGFLFFILIFILSIIFLKQQSKIENN